MTFRRLVASYLARAIVAYLLLIISGHALSYAQPAWLSTAQPRTGEASAPPAGVERQKIKTMTKRDTVVISKIDTIIKIDTVIYTALNGKYTYKLQVCNLDYSRIISLKINLASFDFYKDIFDNLNNEEKMKNCYSSNAVGDTNYVYLYGIETLRSNGFIFDNYGNKLEQTEKILAGVTLRVYGDKIKFDYLENKKISLESSFSDNQAQFYADYTFFERKCNFWIFCNYIDKKQYIFLHLIREVI